jgi:hypothetical protein
MGYNDYAANIPLSGKMTKAPRPASLGVMGGDGTFYIGHYFSANVARVDRILPDGQVEIYMEDHYNRCQDGPGTDMGMFCGPHIWTSMNNYHHIPADTLVLQSHDDSYMRRARNGRVASLCKDGQWREVNRKDLSMILPGFRNWNPGPDGTAITMNDRICKGLTFRVTGIDYDKAVIGPLRGEPPASAKDAGRQKEVEP